MTDTGITLILTVKGVESYCRDLERSVTTIERRVSALDAVQTFLAAMSEPAVQAEADYVAIRKTLSYYLDRARTELQTSQQKTLAYALAEKRLSGIISIYTALSRDAFWQLLTLTSDELGSEKCYEISDWSDQWLTELKERSAEISPYPDAIDFRALGVDVAEYTAMSDIYKFFSNCQTSGVR